MERSRTIFVVAVQVRQLQARLWKILFKAKNVRRVVFGLPAVLLALLLGIYAPLICIIHCHVGPLLSASNAGDHSQHYLCASTPEYASPDHMSVPPVLPLPVYPLAPTLTVLAIAALVLMLLPLYFPLPIWPQQWAAAPLVPPPRDC